MIKGTLNEGINVILANEYDLIQVGTVIN